MQETLQKILEAKDQRQNIRHNMGNQGYATISINFNIPGYPKSNDLSSKVFQVVCKELSHYLIALRIPFDNKNIKNQCDEAGNICFFPFNPKNINLINLKGNLEYFEQKHPLGRILDIDLFDAQVKAISSNKQKPCFICKNKSAIQCMREQSHSYEELQQHVQKKIKEYWEKTQEKTICKTLSNAALWAILTEISLPEKPGLVSPESNGSHTDMNYHTFIESSAAISHHFFKTALIGYQWDGKNEQNILHQLRILGLQMEDDMFVATQNINTQKGIVFLMTFCLFATAFSIKTKQTFHKEIITETLKKLSKNLVNDELGNKSEAQSHGEKCFKTYGKDLAGGIRKEVEDGLPTVFNEIFPFMESINFSSTDNSNKEAFQNQCKRVLLKIMSVNNDTNILFRSDAETLNAVKEKSLNALKSDEKLKNNRHYQNLMNFCKEKNISPGGSADLLAISIFMHKIKNQQIF